MRISKKIRIANRFGVCVIMFCLPIAHGLNSLQLVRPPSYQNYTVLTHHPSDINNDLPPPLGPPPRTLGLRLPRRVILRRKETVQVHGAV